jgi:hypothetical protein
VTMRVAESDIRRLTIMRQSLTRDLTKYSAGGREKPRKRAVPSLPKLSCLEDQSFAPARQLVEAGLKAKPFK